MKAGQYLPPSVPSNIQLIQETEGGLDLGQFFATLRRKALLIAGVTVVVASAAVVKALSDTPVYNARLEILVQPMTAETEVISSVPETLASRETQPKSPLNSDLIKILSSPKVLVPVYQKFKAQYPEICNELQVSDVEITPGDTANNPCYQAVTDEISIKSSGKDSNILQVTYQGLDPDKVRALLQLISKAYLDYSLEARQVDIRRAIQFVEDKLPGLRQRVATFQDRLQQLRQQNDLIDPDSRGSQLSSQVNSFTQQQLETQIQLQQARANYEDLRSQLVQQPTETAASSALNDNPRFQSLLNQLLSLDSKIAATSTIHLETSPDLQILREERQNLLTLLSREGDQSQREVINKIQELETRQQALETTLTSLNSDVRDLSGISREYTDIQRELQIATETLNQFLAKQQALQIDVAQREIPWEILTPPTYPIPSATSLSRNLILGSILGLLLGVATALAIDKVTDVIYTSEELKRQTRLPLLGAIPFSDALRESSKVGRSVALQQLSPDVLRPEEGTTKTSHPRYYSKTVFAEAFRSLYANIRLLNSDSPVHTLAISSTTPGEGKSTVAACLAQAAAAMGRRVLLVDTDLRCPRLHEYLSLSNTKGLTDVISGDLSFDEVVHRSPSEPNMFVLTTGVVPPDPTRSLSSQKMHHLMEQVQDSFDLVIYDTPPLLGFADAYLTAAHTNGIILVTQLGKLKRSLLVQALERLKVSSTPVLGVVLQKVHQSNKL